MNKTEDFSQIENDFQEIINDLSKALKDKNTDKEILSEKILSILELTPKNDKNNKPKV